MILPSLPAYDISEPLGEGGMGQVFKARDSRLDRVVALKFLASRLARDETARKRFINEARLAASVEHPNVCSIFEIGEDDSGRPFISMTYCSGRTLADRLDHAPLAPSDLSQIAEQTASALKAAHERGIIHRDVKPSNIAFSEDGTVKVLDFGIASLRASAEATSEIEAGTVAYMSPEQVQGLPLDTRTDIWSFGIVLYECLTGVHPFRAPYDQATIYNILNSDPRPIDQLADDSDRPWRAIVEKCLARDPDRRFQSMDEILDAIASEPEAKPDTGRQNVPPLEFIGNPPSTSKDLVGRHAERRKLLEIVASDEGLPTAAVVSGESGIGKSQLVRTALADAAANGARVLFGRCVFNEGGLPYHPFVVALKKSFVGDREFDPDKNLEQVVDRLGGDLKRRSTYLRAFLTAGDESAGVLNREQLWDSVLALYRALASASHRLIIVVDDLQWADEATLAFFSFLARSVADDPIRLVAVYRLEVAANRGTTSQAHLIESIRQLRIERTIEEVSLSELDRGDSTALIRSLFDDQPVADDVADAILSKTGGHPLFISEMVGLLRTERIVERKTGIWQFKSEHAKLDILPQRVQDVIQQRLGVLDATDREILEVASIEGDRFASETVAKCLGWPRIDLLKRLQVLESQFRLIHHLDRGYQFDHSLIRKTLYDGVLPELREEYHRIIADALIENHGDDVDFASRIAQHLAASGRRDAAVPFLLKSASRARSVYALDQALTAYTDLEKTLGHLPADAGGAGVGNGDLAVIRLEVALGLGEVQYLLGNVEDAHDQFRQALQLARLGNDQAGEFEAIRKLALCLRLQGRLDDAMQRAREAHDAASRLNEASLIIRALHTLTDVYSSKGEYTEAITTASEALDLSRKEGDLTAQSISQSNLGFSHWHRGLVKESMEYFLAAQSTQRAIGDRSGLATTLNFLALAIWKLGRYEEAIASASESVDIKRQINLQRAIPGSLNIIGDVYRDLYQTEKALQFHRQSFSLAESHGNKGAMCDNLRDIGADFLFAGDVGAATDYFQRALNLATDSGIRWYQTRSHLGLAEAGLKRDDPAAAATHAKKGFELADAIGARELLVEAQWTLARSTSESAGDSSDAVKLLENAFEEANRLGLESLKWQIGVDLARLLSLVDDQERAGLIRRQAADTVQRIADRITDSSLRSRFMSAEPVADLLGLG